MNEDHEPTMNDLLNWLPQDGEWHLLGNGTEVKYCGVFSYDLDWQTGGDGRV